MSNSFFRCIKLLIKIKRSLCLGFRTSLLWYREATLIHDSLASRSGVITQKVSGGKGRQAPRQGKEVEKDTKLKASWAGCREVPVKTRGKGSSWRCPCPLKPSGGAHLVLRCAFLGPFRGVLAPMQRGSLRECEGHTWDTPDPRLSPNPPAHLFPLLCPAS